MTYMHISFRYCPDCINTDVDLIVDKKKKIQNTKSLDALMRMREKECAIGNYHTSFFDSPIIQYREITWVKYLEFIVDKLGKI